METTEILDETKALKEIETELGNVATIIMRKRFQKKFEEQDTIEN